MSAPAARKTEVELPRCPVRYVVVYPDRAEVTREVAVNLDAGEHEVQLKNISQALDKDSVRVDGVGAASITEVSFQEIPVTVEQDNQTEMKEEVTKLEEELTNVKDKLTVLLKRKERLRNQQELLKKYSENLIASSSGAESSQLVNQNTIDGVFSFMETFERQSLDVMTKQYDSDLEQKELEERQRDINKRLSDLKPKIKKDNEKDEPVMQSVIGVLLAVKEKGDIKLLVSYVVSNAKWTPKYDLRVNSAERTMQVSYFGMVQQNTGEDWVDAKLSLSTASPSIGGNAPELETLRLNLLHFDDSRQKENYYRRNWDARFGDDYDRLRVPPPPPPPGAGGELPKRGRVASDAPLAVPQAQVSEGLSSSVFEIVALATIPSDNSGHKVSVCTIDLKPTFEYETVPKLSQHAFLKAKVKNESRYPLLAGPANVFLDQAFVTKTSLNNVSPQEEFSCSLGADPSVKVVYKPVNRFREESGLINVSVIFTYRQVTEITNTRKEPAKIFFTDQIPLSRDDKLKVTLLEPVIAKVKQGQPLPNPNLTAQNHLTWSLELNPQETKTVSIRYAVEYPKNKEIEGL